MSRQKSSFLCGGDHESWPDSSSEVYSSYVLRASPGQLPPFPKPGKGGARKSLEALLELIDEEVDVLLDLLVGPLAAREALHERQELGDEHRREVLRGRLDNQVPERGDDDADDLLLDRVAREVRQERDHVVLAATRGVGQRVSEWGKVGRRTG